MDYDATMVLNNTFFSLRLTNHDDRRETVERDAEYLANRLGATYMYMEEIKNEPA